MAKAHDLKRKKQPRQARAKAMVEALLDSTARILESEGYAAVTTNRVADVAGVSIGSVYEYFPNKQSLVAATLARAIQGIVADVATGLRTALALEDQPRAGIDYWMRAMLKALEKRAGLMRVALREVPFLWDIPEVRDLARTLQQIAIEGQRKSQRVVRFDDPEASTWLMLTMVGGAVQQIALYRPSHLSRERLTATLVETVLKLL
jgi:AcrR family transcriptional regulator